MQIWNRSLAQPVGEIYRHQGLVKAVAFSPDGKMVATASFDKTARILDAATGRPIGPPLRLHREVAAVGFYSQGNLLFTLGPGDTSITSWAVPSPILGMPENVAGWCKSQLGVSVSTNDP